MHVTITGSKGMLGTDLMSACAAAGFAVRGLDLPEVDITDMKRLDSQLPEGEWLVNCAAFTRVDDAEADREKAFQINTEGAHNVAMLCARRHIKMIQISTDYVFDGRKDRAYHERDKPSPLNIYGASKMAGERAVRASGARFLIVRTQSLYGVHGPNFVRTIARRLLESDEPLKVVSDQVSSPTYTRHLAGALIRLMNSGRLGVVHVAASGECSWFEFAEAIAARIKPGAVIRSTTASEMARPAKRPSYSVLNTDRYQSWTSHTLPNWETGLDEYLAEENNFRPAAGKPG